MPVCKHLLREAYEHPSQPHGSIYGLAGLCACTPGCRGCGYPRRAAPNAALGGDTVTISQAARDLAERDAPIRPVLAVGLAPVAGERSAADGPVNAIASSSQDYKAAIDQAIDSLEFQRNSKLITEAQFRHDMAFYTRVANAVA